MSWVYKQSTGELLRNSVCVGLGYAGAGLGKNNPDMQNVKDTGPLPCGEYHIEDPVDTRTHGPFVLWLAPSAENEMFGRSAFGIHGDSVVKPGTASEGCIVTLRSTREAIAASGDKVLQVIP